MLYKKFFSGSEFSRYSNFSACLDILIGFKQRKIVLEIEFFNSESFNCHKSNLRIFEYKAIGYGLKLRKVFCGLVKKSRSRLTFSDNVRLILKADFKNSSLWRLHGSYRLQKIKNKLFDSSHHDFIWVHVICNGVILLIIYLVLL